MRILHYIVLHNQKTTLRYFILIPMDLPSQLEVKQETNIGCQ